MEILTAAFGIFSFEILYSTCLHAGSLALDEIHQIKHPNKQNKKTEPNLRTVPMTTTALSTIQESEEKEGEKEEVMNEEIETAEPVATTTTTPSTTASETATIASEASEASEAAAAAAAETTASRTAIISTVTTTITTTIMVEIKETKDEPMPPGEEHTTEDQIRSAPSIAQSLNEPLVSNPPALPEPVVTNRLCWEP